MPQSIFIRNQKKILKIFGKDLFTSYLKLRAHFEKKNVL